MNSGYVERGGHLLPDPKDSSPHELCTQGVAHTEGVRSDEPCKPVAMCLHVSAESEVRDAAADGAGGEDAAAGELQRLAAASRGA